jgi:hypothetical protein
MFYRLWLFSWKSSTTCIAASYYHFGKYES